MIVLSLHFCARLHSNFAYLLSIPLTFILHSSASPHLLLLLSLSLFSSHHPLLSYIIHLGFSSSILPFLWIPVVRGQAMSNVMENWGKILQWCGHLTLAACWQDSPSGLSWSIKIPLTSTSIYAIMKMAIDENRAMAMTVNDKWWNGQSVGWGGSLSPIIYPSITLWRRKKKKENINHLRR